MVYLVTAPSGAGKSLLSKTCGIPAVITFTTRPPRKGERNGVDYYFVDEATFRSYKEEGRFVESNRFGDFWYATPKSGLRGAEDRLLIVDPNGSLSVGEWLDREEIEYRRVWIDTPLCLRHIFLMRDSSRPKDELAQRVNDGVRELWIKLGLKADIVLPMADYPLNPENSAA